MGKYAEHMHQKLVPHPYLVSVNTCKYNQCIQKTPLDIETSSINMKHKRDLKLVTTPLSGD